MTFSVFIATFWPMIAIFLVAYVAIPILATALSLADRRRYVRRLHRMRRN